MTTTTTTRTPRAPRIAPGGVREIGRLNTLIAGAIGRTMGTIEPPRLFTTLARHRRLYWCWLPFAGALMPRGKLLRADSELVILRVQPDEFSAAGPSRLAALVSSRRGS